MAQDELFEKLFDEILSEAASQLSEQESNANLPEEVPFSPEHEKKMQELFRAERKKQHRKNHSSRTKRLLCVLIACMIVSVGCICSVGAWRIRLMNYFFKPENPNTTFTFNDEHAYVYSDKKVYLGYVPEGFVLTEQADEPYIVRTFSKDNISFELSIYEIDGHLSLDTENGTVEDITINGMKGVTTASKLINSVILHDDDWVYCFSGNIAQDELIKIAQNYQK